MSRPKHTHQHSVSFPPYLASSWEAGTCNEAIRCFHQFFSPIFYIHFFPCIFLSWAVDKENKFLSKTVFSQFASWKRNHNKYCCPLTSLNVLWIIANKQFADSEFEIGETILWIRYMFYNSHHLQLHALHCCCFISLVHLSSNLVAPIWPL